MEKSQNPSERYHKKNITQISLKLNKKTDADILEKLETIDNNQGYIKKLIRNDIEKEKGAE